MIKQKTKEEMFDELWEVFDMGDERDVDRDYVKKFIEINYTPKNTPMGVSAWKEHGKRYGFDKYFEKDYIKKQRLEEEVEKLQTMVGQLVYANENEEVDRWIKQILNELKEFKQSL